MPLSLYLFGFPSGNKASHLSRTPESHRIARNLPCASQALSIHAQGEQSSSAELTSASLKQGGVRLFRTCFNNLCNSPSSSLYYILLAQGSCTRVCVEPSSLTTLPRCCPELCLTTDNSDENSYSFQITVLPDRSYNIIVFCTYAISFLLSFLN